MIRVVAVVTANPGRHKEILSVFRANVANVRAEKGCIEDAAQVDAADIGPFQRSSGRTRRRSGILVEPGALRAHIATPHMKAYGQRTKDLIASRAIHVLSATD